MKATNQPNQIAMKKKVELRRMILRNFKGIRELDISEFKHITEIGGRNESGKTTIFDAFTFVLTGKDSANSSEFNIKPLDQTGQKTDKIESEAEIWLEEFDQNYTPVTTRLRRTVREKWVRRRAAEVETFDGNETIYSVNDVPVTKREFDAKVATIIPEAALRMITNPLYFNTKVKWEERREILSRVANVPTDSDIIADSAFEDLKGRIRTKSIEAIKKEMRASKANVEGELAVIPARIDEATQSIPETINEKKVRAGIEDLQQQIKSIDERIEQAGIADASEYEKKQKAEIALHDLKRQLTNLEQERKFMHQNNIREQQEKIDGLRRQITELDRGKAERQSSRVKAETRLTQLEIDLAVVRDKFKSIDAEFLTIPENAMCCPTCQRAWDEDKQETTKADMQKNFNSDKVKRLDDIRLKGKHIATLLDETKIILRELGDADDSAARQMITEKIEAAERTLEIIKEAAPAPDKKEFELRDQIDGFQIPEIKTADTTELKKERDELRTQMTSLQMQLATIDQAKRTHDRIETLKKQEKELGMKLAELERIEIQIEKFTKDKVDLIEKRVNGLFQYVRWRMFDVQVNGALDPTCECTVNGVPFSDLNNAARINAGIDVINGLCEELYGVTAPIFIDNAESVNDIMDSAGQQVRLIVTTDRLEIKTFDK